MNTDERIAEQRLEARTKTMFDESVARLDAATRSKLAKARNRALQELDESAAPMRRRLRQASLVVASLSVAVLAVSLLMPRDDMDSVDMRTLTESTDFEILFAEEELEMFEELEFYAWLDEQPELQDGDDSAGGAG
jgi:hypothetical protein